MTKNIYFDLHLIGWVSLGGDIEKATGFRCSFLLLRSDKLSVFPNIVVVFISWRFGLPFGDKAHKSVYENVLHFIGVRTRLLLAEGEGVEPPLAFTNPVFKTGAIGLSANLPFEIRRNIGECAYLCFPRKKSASVPAPECVPITLPT